MKETSYIGNVSFHALSLTHPNVPFVQMVLLSSPVISQTEPFLCLVLCLASYSKALTKSTKKRGGCADAEHSLLTV